MCISNGDAAVLFIPVYAIFLHLALHSWGRVWGWEGTCVWGHWKQGQGEKPHINTQRTYKCVYMHISNWSNAYTCTASLTLNV